MYEEFEATPGDNINASATLENVPPPKIPDNLSYGDLDENQGKALVNQAFALTNKRRTDVFSREPKLENLPDDPGAVSPLIPASIITATIGP